MLEHIADAIANDEFKDGQLIMVGATQDGSAATIGSNRIAFADLRIVIWRMHKIAAAMLSAPMEFASPSATSK
jgi:hypothetical protein